MTNIAAIIKDGAVINTIVINWVLIPTFKENKNFDGDDLIPVDESVTPGDTYDAETGIFYRDGIRVYPAKTADERLAELEAAFMEMKSDLKITQKGLIEVAEIVGGEENGRNIQEVD